MDNLEQTSIYCKKHPDHIINFINLMNDNYVCCDECQSEEGYQIKDYISIQTIKVCKNNYIFNNWPPVNDSQLLKDISSALRSDNLTTELLEQQFQQIINEITSKLNEIKKKMIQQIIIQDEKKSQLLKSYNEVSGKQKFKELVQFKQQSLETQIQDLKSFIIQHKKQTEENTSFLKDQLQLFKSQQSRQNTITFAQQDLLDQVDIFCSEIYSAYFEQKLGKNEQNDNQIDQIFRKSAFSKIGSSNQIQALDNKNENKMRIIKLENLYGRVYFKKQLNQENNYAFRFKFNQIAGEQLFIGLIDHNNTDGLLNETFKGKIFNSNHNLYGGKVVQGDLFYQVEKEFILEMRIDIQNGQIQYLDYPNYQNINELNEGKELDPNKNYFLAIQFAYSTQKVSIDLIYFKEDKK